MIRITWVSENVRGIPREFHEDDDDGPTDLPGAMTEFLKTSFAGDHPSPGSGPLVVALVIERDGTQLDYHEVADALQRIVSMERTRAAVSGPRRQRG